MNSTLKAAAIAAGALVLMLGPAGAAPTSRSAGDGGRNVDLTASAHPTEVAPTPRDDAFDVTSTWRRTVRADTTALSSTTCDSCWGDATTLQVLYLHHARSVSVDNAAVAWSQCASCGGTALSVQVVVASGAREIDADNRALATNAACTGCTTAALAYQLVVVSPDRSRLSKDALQDLRDWVARQSLALRQSPTSPPLERRKVPGKAAKRAAVSLEGLVNGDLGSRTRELDVKRG